VAQYQEKKGIRKFELSTSIGDSVVIHGEVISPSAKSSEMVI
jgi:hypothetical protein